MAKFACHSKPRTDGSGLACSSGGHSPALNVFWIGPHQVTEWSLVWYLAHTVDYAHFALGPAFAHPETDLRAHRGRYHQRQPGGRWGWGEKMHK